MSYLSQHKHSSDWPRAGILTQLTFYAISFKDSFYTRIMINKGMVNKGKYWIYGKNKGVSVSNFEEPKGRHKSIQYWISF